MKTLSSEKIKEIKASTQQTKESGRFAQLKNRLL